MKGLVKTECIRTTVVLPRAIQDARGRRVRDPAGGVDWYSNRRPHGTLGMNTPIEFETLHYEPLTREP